MRFLADECVVTDIVTLLRTSGHDVSSINELSLKGLADPAVAHLARLEDRILITQDRQARETHWQLRPHDPGLIVIRIKHTDMQAIRSAVLALLERVTSDDLRDSIVLLRRDHFEIRTHEKDPHVVRF